MDRSKRPANEQAKRCWFTASQYRLMSVSTNDPLVQDAQRAVADAYADVAECWEWLERFRKVVRENERQ
jgi:hypothetical protein